MEKLGGEFQRTDVDVKASVWEARNTFLGLVSLLTPQVFRSLLQPCRLDSLPEDSRNDWTIQNCWIRFFLLHTKEHSWFLKDTEKLGCAPDVRQTPLLAYFDYLHKNKVRLEEFTKQSEVYWESVVARMSWTFDSLVADRTIHEFIPNWNELQSRSDSNWLCNELLDWANHWNLQADWCLDFALECLGIIKNGYVDRFHPPDDYLKSNDFFFEFKQRWWGGSAWAKARVEKVKLVKVWTDFEYNNNLPAETVEKLEFKYSWPRSLRLDDQEAIVLREVLFPFGTKPFSQFITAMEEAFWGQFFAYFGDKWTFCTGNTDQIGREIRRFQKELKGFVTRTRKTMESLANVEKTISIESDKHFRWLIEFQIKKVEYGDIAKNEGIDQKTIRDGVEAASQLIDLCLRPPNRKRGRPKDSKTVITGAGRTVQKLIRG